MSSVTAEALTADTDINSPLALGSRWDSHKLSDMGENCLITFAVNLDTCVIVFP